MDLNFTTYAAKNRKKLNAVLEYCSDNFIEKEDGYQVDWSAFPGGRTKGQSMYARARDHYMELLPDLDLSPKDVYMIHRIFKMFEDNREKMTEGFIRDIISISNKRKVWKGKDFPISKYSKDQILTLEMDFPDIHLGQLIWADECGKNWDTPLASGAFVWSVRDQLSQMESIRDMVKTVVLPVGNDYLNSDNKNNETANGTPQQEDGRHQKTFLTASKTVIFVLHEVAQFFPKANIVVPIIPGNHDETRAFYLGHAIECMFHGHPRISVDNGPKLRKYYRDGDFLIGWTHGAYENIQQIHTIMHEERRDASSVSHKEMHLGHRHTNREWRILEVDQYKNMRIRMFNALTPADEWHTRKDYIKSIREGRSLLWHPRFGLRQQFHSVLADGEPTDAELMAIYEEVMAE